MKRRKSLFVLSFALICSLPVYAVPIMPVFDAAAQSVMQATHAENLVYMIQQIQQMTDNVYNTYNQLQYTIEANKRALNNLKGIADVKSFDEFMKWNNRQLYLEQQSEAQFNRLGVKIGEKTYKMADIDKIPGALKDQFEDPLAKDLTEEQRAEMYYKLGLSPSNYAYIQTWQAREDAIAQSILTRSQIIAEEQAVAAQRNSDLAAKYTREDGNLDSNEILKDTGITLSNVEMVLRELTGIIAQKNEYDLARDSKEDAPANAPASRENDIKNYWKPITKGVGEDNFTD